MSPYTRFPNSDRRENSSAQRGLTEHQQAAERLFRRAEERPLTRGDRTAETAKQIVLEESKKRRTLSEALRVARLERAGRLTETTRNTSGSKPDN